MSPKKNQSFLWEFCTEALDNETYGDIMRWENKEKGIFSIYWYKKNNKNWEEKYTLFYHDYFHKKTGMDISVKSCRQNCRGRLLSAIGKSEYINELDSKKERDDKRRYYKIMKRPDKPYFDKDCRRGKCLSTPSTSQLTTGRNATESQSVAGYWSEFCSSQNGGTNNSPNGNTTNNELIGELVILLNSITVPDMKPFCSDRAVPGILDTMESAIPFINLREGNHFQPELADALNVPVQVNNGNSSNIQNGEKLLGHFQGHISLNKHVISSFSNASLNASFENEEERFETESPMDFDPEGDIGRYSGMNAGEDSLYFEPLFPELQDLKSPEGDYLNGESVTRVHEKNAVGGQISFSDSSGLNADCRDPVQQIVATEDHMSFPENFGSNVDYEDPSQTTDDIDLPLAVEMEDRNKNLNEMINSFVEKEDDSSCVEELIGNAEENSNFDELDIEFIRWIHG